MKLRDVNAAPQPDQAQMMRIINATNLLVVGLQASTQSYAEALDALAGAFGNILGQAFPTNEEDALKTLKNNCENIIPPVYRKAAKAVAEERERQSRIVTQ